MDGANDRPASPSSKSLSTPDPGPETSAEHPDTQSKDEAPYAVRAEEVKGFVLKFLATSSNESLAGVFVGLAIATYVLLGRLGLLLIGLVLGVVLHASWEGTSDESKPEGPDSRNPRRRKELALELASRLLDWPERARGELPNGDEDNRQRTVETRDGRPETDLDYSAFGPRTSVALKALTDAAVRDYVL